MEAIWESGIPLKSVEMLELPDISTWNETNLYRTINALLDKKLIRVCGVEHILKKVTINGRYTKYGFECKPHTVKEG